MNFWKFSSTHNFFFLENPDADDQSMMLDSNAQYAEPCNVGSESFRETLSVPFPINSGTNIIFNLNYWCVIVKYFVKQNQIIKNTDISWKTECTPRESEW